MCISILEPICFAILLCFGIDLLCQLPTPLVRKRVEGITTTVPRRGTAHRNGPISFLQQRLIHDVYQHGPQIRESLSGTCNVLDDQLLP